MMQYITINNIILFGATGATLSILILFTSSILYYFFSHNNGTLQYLFKTIIIGLITTPVAIVLLFVLVHYVCWQKGILSAWRYISHSNKKKNENTITNTESADVLVHLIHGTFEPNAPWTQSNSDLCKEINKVNPTLGISRFVWDGKNTETSRKNAAQQLGNHIKNSPAKYNYIIAHSHGAAIVREMSYMFGDVARKVEGVCLLSPPFIYRRKITRTSGALMHLIDISGSLSIQLMLVLILKPFGLYNFSFALLIFALTAFAEVKLSQKYKKEVLSEVEDGRLREAVDFRNVEIYHAIGDEADSGLRFVSSLHEGCFAIFSQLKKAQTSQRKLIHWSAFISYILHILAGLLVWEFYPQDTAWLISLLVSFTIVFLSHIFQWLRPSRDIPHVLIIAAMPVAIFSFWLALAKGIAYGDLRLIFCPEVFIASSETPAGDHRVLKFAPQSDGVLMHATHSNTEALQNVAQWLYFSEKERKKRNP
ncbi:hypothetical protein [Klebsiella michiganensis]|uniref:hypothetical protein n=1 Tax=Klebsiella michiganensis TaxID=1134687 RepID=UPI0011E4AD2C|nr:hypothetical protein [Klebsiella michiganensis]TYD81684.1 hypothetical protein DJ519_26185 [Klebsiella michiganensis]